jgi:hypothetical protein
MLAVYLVYLIIGKLYATFRIVAVVDGNIPFRATAAPARIAGSSAITAVIFIFNHPISHLL